MSQSQEKSINDSDKTVSSSSDERSTQPSALTVTERTPLLPTESSKTPSVPEADVASDSCDKRIKKPPPYHIAAVLSRHAADFTESNVDVSSSVAGDHPGSESPVKEQQTHQQVWEMQIYDVCIALQDNYITGWDVLTTL